MSNATDKLSTANRALIVGALAGGSASIARHLPAHRAGEISTDTMVCSAAQSAIKTAAVAGTTTYIAEKMAGRPLLSMLTILSVGAAGLYLMDQTKETMDEQQ
ncbi:hypothetical protein [Vibrio sp. WXL210]|uniref:hypothetical protein n=1 Tax=Vibrio sp. WXL210 TaxID=3450709 RepID=UPI003EC5AFD8